MSYFVLKDPFDLDRMETEVGKGPTANWAPVVAYCCNCEMSARSDNRMPSTTNDYGFKVLTSDDDGEGKKG